MDKWRHLQLGDVIELKRGYDLPKRKRVNGDFPIISSSGFSGKHNEAKVDPPGVVTGRYGTIGEVFYVQKPFWPLNTALYVRDFKGNDSKFIFYFLKQFNFQKFNDKSTVPGVNRNHLHTENVLLPPLPEQRAIASVLSSLDDKIDLLHRQNRTLEAMAEALFRQWFVVEAGVDWDEIKLYDSIQLVGGGTPKTTKKSYWEGNIPWLSGKDIAANHKGFLLTSEKSITEVGIKNSSAKVLPKFSTVITARGTVGKISILGREMAFSQSNYGILPQYRETYFFTFLLIENVLDRLHRASYGTVFDTITIRTFKNISIPFPPLKIIEEFEELVKPLFLKKLNNSEQANQLSDMRDSLLPKLMSGAVRVEP